MNSISKFNLKYRKFQATSKDYETRFNVVSTSENQSSSSTIASSSSSLNKLNASSATSGSTATTNNLALNSNKTNSPYQIIGLKNDTILPGNINVLTVLSPSTTNANNSNNNTAYQISTYNPSNSSSNTNPNLHHPQQPHQNHHQISYTNNSTNAKRLSNITVS